MSKSLPSSMFTGFMGHFCLACKGAVLPAALALTIAFCSCSLSDDWTPGHASAGENVLRYDVPGPISSLNPMKEKPSASMFVFPWLYSYLFVPDNLGELQPDLAVSWTRDSKLTWTIYLRGDALFHDKRPVTSRDVAYSLSATLSSARPSAYSTVESITPLTDTTLRIALKKEDPNFLMLIAQLAIIPEPGEGKVDYYNHPIGSGPFRFAYRQGDEQVALVSNEDYYNGKPAIDRVVFQNIPNKEKSWARLMSGKTDIAQEIYPTDYKIIKDHQDEFYFNISPLQSYSILLYNTAHPLFSDPKVRRALSHAIDRESIIRDVLKGFGVIAPGPMGAGSPYHDPDLAPVGYSPKRSVELLREAGWSPGADGRYLEKNGKVFEFTIIYPAGDQVSCSAVEYIQLDLNEIGIRTSSQAIRGNELMRRYFGNNEFEAVLTEAVGAFRDLSGLQCLWSPTAKDAAWCGSFYDPGVSRILDEAVSESDPQKRRRLFYQADRLITSLQPGTFLFHKTAFDVMSKRVIAPFPFSLDFAGLSHLRKASIQSRW